MADADTHQQVFAPPPAAKLSNHDRSTPMVRFPFPKPTIPQTNKHQLPLYNTNAAPPPPYMPPTGSGFQQPLPAPYKQNGPAMIQIRQRHNRRGAYICIGVGVIVLLIIPSIIFSIVVTQVNRNSGFSSRHGRCSSDGFSTCYD